GTYSIGVQAGAAFSGAFSLSLTAPSDITGTITPGGSAVTVTTSTIGQDVRLTFSASSGQKVSAMVTNVTNPGATVYLVRPDGQTTTGNVSIATGGPFFLNTQTLLESGLYTLWVQHSGANVGSETLQLYSANDVTGTITIDG